MTSSGSSSTESTGHTVIVVGSGAQRVTPHLIRPLDGFGVPAGSPSLYRSPLEAYGLDDIVKVEGVDDGLDLVGGSSETLDGLPQLIECPLESVFRVLPGGHDVTKKNRVERAGRDQTRGEDRNRGNCAE